MESPVSKAHFEYPPEKCSFYKKSRNTVNQLIDSLSHYLQLVLYIPFPSTNSIFGNISPVSSSGDISHTPCSTLPLARFAASDASAAQASAAALAWGFAATKYRGFGVVFGNCHPQENERFGTLNQSFCSSLVQMLFCFFPRVPLKWIFGGSMFLWDATARSTLGSDLNSHLTTMPIRRVSCSQVQNIPHSIQKSTNGPKKHLSEYKTHH